MKVSFTYEAGDKEVTETHFVPEEYGKMTVDELYKELVIDRKVRQREMENLRKEGE